TVIAGNPGLGKSQITAWLAARVTKGSSWPDSHEITRLGDVLFLSAEDDAADTIKPRLVAADADVARCHILQAVTTKSGKRGFDLSQDMERISNAVRSMQGNVRLVVIDPISAYLGRVDGNNNSEVRGLMMQLKDMAEEHDV